jgi:hypothetical protein
MSMRLRIGVAALIGVAMVSAVHAEVSRGDRVRITRLGETRVIGYLESSDAAAVTLRTDGGTNPITIPMKEVTAAELSLGMRSHELRGAVIGGVTGFLIGAFVGAYISAGSWSWSKRSDDNGAYAAWAGITLAGVGAGVLIAHAVRGEKWRPLWKSELESVGE